ncbi:Uncharacterised protein [Chlamydia abortus]|uniref:DUF4367 domain-containing protein n=1 Tax=Paenibacillus residui TaxID=629724 RepID=A0ABW3DIX2_9BACL|nr:Uncharacterised protein [Chlamydia abortus]
MRKEEEWDRLLDSVFEDAVRENYRCEVPDPTPSWEKVREKLKAEKRRRARRRWRSRIATIAASLLIGAFIFSTPQITNAFAPLTAIFKQLTGNMLSFFYGESGLEERTGAKTSPPPPTEEPPQNIPEDHSDGSRASTTLKISMEEAKQKSSIPLLEPQYVLDGYKLDSVKLSLDQHGQTLNAVIYYENEEGGIYLVTQSVLELNTVYTTLSDENDTVKDVEIKGRKGKLIQGSDKNDMILTDEGRLIRITGQISVEELYSIAESLQ